MQNSTSADERGLHSALSLVDAPRWQMAIPLLGGAFACYAVYRNVFVGQEGTSARLPWIELACLVIGLGVVLLAPGLSDRVRRGLASGTLEATAPTTLTQPAT